MLTLLYGCGKSWLDAALTSTFNSARSEGWGSYIWFCWCACRSFYALLLVCLCCTSFRSDQWTNFSINNKNNVNKWVTLQMFLLCECNKKSDPQSLSLISNLILIERGYCQLFHTLENSLLNFEGILICIFIYAICHNFLKNFVFA